MKELGVALRQPMKNLASSPSMPPSRLRRSLGATPTLDVALHARLRKHGEFFEKHVAELKDHTSD